MTLALAANAAAWPWGGDCTTDEKNLDSYAKSRSQGKNPDGRCYSHVADYIDAVGFGGINPGHFDDCIPPQYWAEAHQFADYLNTGNNAANLCLKNDQSKYSNNPYKAPTGSIVVVRAGTPGTAHPTAGDIAVAGDGDYFWNGGEMSYGGSANFPSNNDYVLGIYVPTKCTPDCPNVPQLTQQRNETLAKESLHSENPYRTYRVMGSTCTGDHEFCCEAPNADPSNCPPSAYTSDCASKNSCCCA